MTLLTVTARLAHTSSLIEQTCTLNTRPPGPFTYSMLGNIPLQDLIRDADESERKLVRLEGEDVGRREVAPAQTGAARARKSMGGLGEGSVEIYAGAALELVEEYESMPRARQHILSLLARSAELHESIASLQGALAAGQQQSPEKPANEPSPSSLQTVETHVRDLEEAISSTRQKRDTLRTQLRTLRHSRPSPSVSPTASPAAPPPRASLSTPRADEGNNPFLSRGPLAQASGVLAMSVRKPSVVGEEDSERAESPTPAVRRGVLGLEEEEEEERRREEESSVEEQLQAEAEEVEEEEEEEEDESQDQEMDEPTVVLHEASRPAPPPQPSPVRARQTSEPKLVITPAIELAVAKIWSTSAGQSLDPSLEEGSSLPPQETLALLRTLLDPPSPPTSPAPAPSSLSSLLPSSTHPTPDTVLLARLLLALLTAPSLLVPLNALKELLKGFAVERGFEDAGEKALRAVYGGVGRGVVRIDRARGVVLFA